MTNLLDIGDQQQLLNVPVTTKYMKDSETKDVKEIVYDKIEDNDVVLFIKGERDEPRCGFSERALILTFQYTDEAEVVNVLDNLDEFRDSLKEHSDRKTIPQVFVDGEFIGGSDILMELEKQGELESTIQLKQE